MKNFKVTTNHDIYEDSYENGEGDNVNNYTITSEQEAENTIEAIKKHYENTLFYNNFDVNLAQFEPDENRLYYSTLVDADNYEPSINKIDNWKVGKFTLYSNNITFSICELVEQTF